jgi:uncharacterized membrane protein HdeD (DUF308 family)
MLNPTHVHQKNRTKTVWRGFSGEKFSQQLNTMTQQFIGQRWWLLTARAGLYVLFGIVMFVFASSFTAQSAVMLGVVLIGAGLAGLVFGLTNGGIPTGNFWLLLTSGFDVAFGITILADATGTIKGFVDILGFWAMVYAFLQSVQAMYVFMSERTAGKANYPVWVLHFASLAVSGALTFNLLLRPAGFATSLGYSGLFPIALGVLLFLINNRLRQQLGTNTTR